MQTRGDDWSHYSFSSYLAWLLASWTISHIWYLRPVRLFLWLLGRLLISLKMKAKRTVTRHFHTSAWSNAICRLLSPLNITILAIVTLNIPSKVATCNIEMTVISILWLTLLEPSPCVLQQTESIESQSQFVVSMMIDWFDVLQRRVHVYRRASSQLRAKHRCFFWYIEHISSTSQRQRTVLLSSKSNKTSTDSMVDWRRNIWS